MKQKRKSSEAGEEHEEFRNRWEQRAFIREQRSIQKSDHEFLVDWFASFLKELYALKTSSNCIVFCLFSVQAPAFRCR